MAFDYIELLDNKNNVVKKYDIGAEEIRNNLGFGWYDDEKRWDDINNYTWAGGAEKKASIYLNRFSATSNIRLRYLAATRGWIGVSLNGKLLQRFQANQPHQWETITFKSGN